MPSAWVYYCPKRRSGGNLAAAHLLLVKHITKSAIAKLAFGFKGYIKSFEEDPSMLYRDSRMETYRSTHVSLDDPCQVRIDAGVITVEYISDGQPVRYQGREKGPGHYELHAVGFDGRATLHTFDGSALLEGGWTEEGAKGMWRIWLR